MKNKEMKIIVIISLALSIITTFFIDTTSIFYKLKDKYPIVNETSLFVFAFVTLTIFVGIIALTNNKEKLKS